MNEQELREKLRLLKEKKQNLEQELRDIKYNKEKLEQEIAEVKNFVVDMFGTDDIEKLENTKKELEKEADEILKEVAAFNNNDDEQSEEL